MKIAILSFYSGVVARGAETYVHELANRLVELGHEVLVYQSGSKLKDAKYKTISIRVTTRWDIKGSFLSRNLYFSGKIKKFTEQVLIDLDNSVDIVLPTNGQWQVVKCSIWAKWHHKKMVVSGQSGHGFDDRINLYSFPDKFVVLTDSQALWAHRVNPFVNIEKIPNGVDLNKFKGGLNAINFGLPKPTVLYVGAFEFLKRQELAIRAVSEYGKASLVLVGSGALQEKLQKIGDKLLPGRFKIVSYKHYEMPKVYRGAELFTYPTSTFESFGIAMIEAMATGLPVVATDDSKRREVVGDAGLFVDPENTAEYAEVIKKALETNWGNKPRLQAEKYNWDIIAQKYEKLFKTLIKEE